MSTAYIDGSPCTVLLIEDSVSDAILVQRALASVDNARYRMEHVTQLSDALERLGRGGVDVVLLDLALPDSGGLETFQAVSACAPTAPIVVVTGREDEHLALELLQQGAQDYLLKNDIEPKLLARSIRFAIERCRATSLESLNLQLERAQASLTAVVSKLVRANEDLAQFTHFASHDLQEPVRKIVFFVEQLRGDIGDDLSDDARQDIGLILDAGRRMQALISSLLALSRAGNAEMEWGPVDLERCVSEALESLSTQIESKSASIVCDSLPVVDGDWTLLRHLYQNLIGNALKFSNGKAPTIHLTAEPSGQQWTLGVRDNGIGIEPAFAQSVFAPFVRLNGRDKFEGTGIGLSICSKVVDRHGGRIWVDSKLAAGAHFKFLLPAHGENDRLATVPSSASSLS